MIQSIPRIRCPSREKTWSPSRFLRIESNADFPPIGFELGNASCWEATDFRHETKQHPHARDRENLQSQQNLKTKLHARGKCNQQHSQRHHEKAHLRRKGLSFLMSYVSDQTVVSLPCSVLLCGCSQDNMPETEDAATSDYDSRQRLQRLERLDFVESGSGVRLHRLGFWLLSW